jgi:hypothetical protein
MPNAIKYKAGNLTGSLQKGNVALGVSGSLGPTSTTGWYNGPNPPTSGLYQIIETAASGDPEVYSPQNDAELIRFARWKGATGANTGSAVAVLDWIGTQTNLMAINFQYENIVTDGLVSIFDAGFVSSYPTTGTTWYDISGNNTTGSLINGPTFNSANSGSIYFDGVDDVATTSMTVEAPANSNLQSIGVWLNENSTNNSFTGTNADQNGACHLIINWQHPNQIRFAQTWYGGHPTESTDYATVTSLGWNYMVVVKKAVKTYDVYFNGSKVISDVTKEAYISTQFKFGNWWNGRMIPMKGIAVVQSYNRALSAAEVTQNYNAQKGRFGL